MLLECQNERTADEEEMVSGWIFVNVKGQLPAHRERERERKNYQNYQNENKINTYLTIVDDETALF